MKARTLIPLVLSVVGLTTGCAKDVCKDPGTVCTIAGTGQAGFSGEGELAREAWFYRPTDVAARPGTREITVADYNNHRIREIDAGGVITTIVGTPMPGDGPPDQSDRDPPGAPGTTVALNHPVQIEWNADGSMLWLPSWHNHKIRTYDPSTGNVVVVAGDTTWEDGNGANAGFSGDGGPAEHALMAFPNSLAFDAAGNLFFVDQKNERVREIDAAAANINTVAGDGTLGFTGDGGDPLLAEFAFVDSPTNIQPEPAGAIEVADDGTLYVADTWNHCIRHVDLSVPTIDAIMGDGTAGFDDVHLNEPHDVEIGPDGRLYVADTGNHVIRAIDLSSGAVETVLGTGEQGMGEDGSPATEMALSAPYGLDFDADGALIVADTYNNRILRVTPEESP